jgi:hypothetical protein
VLDLKRILFFLTLVIITHFSSRALDKPLEEKREALTKAFKTAFEASIPEHFESLPGGFSSPGIYKVTVKNRPYVVRLSHPKRKVQDEQRTMTCLALSSERQISPKVYYTSAEDGLVIMDYIEPKKLSWEELTDASNLKELASVIKRLHAGPNFLEFLSVFDVRRSFERMLGDEKPQFLDELSVELAMIEKLLKESEIDACPCHHDLKLDNLLFDGEKFWLIDWEAACQGNILFDLATVITFVAMTMDQEEIFLKSYFGEKITDMQRYHLNLMKQVVLCYYGTAHLMVAKIRYQQSPITQDPSSLPEAENFLRSHIKNSSSSISPENIQEFGLVLLNQAFKNLQYMKNKI